MEKFVEIFLKHKILILLRGLIDFEMRIFLVYKTVICFQELLHLSGQFDLIIHHNILRLGSIDLLDHIGPVLVNP